MNPVTLLTLEGLETLNKETLYVLLRFYLNVDQAVPLKYLPTLLGDREFFVEYPPKGFRQSLNHFIAHFLSGIGFVESAVTSKMRGRFMVQDACGKLYITTVTKKALSLYIRRSLSLHGTLPEAVKYTTRDWDDFKLNSQRYGDWDGF